MSKLSKALIAAAGNSGGAGLTVEDVFSTYLYTGDGDASPITINNGIDLENEGGLIWVKKRNQSGNHYIHDTDMVSDRYLSSNNNFDLQGGVQIYPTSTGFTSENKIQDNFNYSGDKFASWTFRKAEKFFDVVTYTGDGNATKAISHNLGSTPGFIVVKRTNGTGYWIAGHNSDYTKYLMLNETNGFQTWTGNWNATDSAFTAYSSANASFSLNNSGDTYVAYLFASDAGGFGDDGSESIIKCGSYTGNSSTNGPEIDLGFEPQWVIIKRTTAATSWFLHDNMRGMTYETNNVSWLAPNTSDAELNLTTTDGVMPTATGFKIGSGGANWNESGNNYIYIAIRRPMKTPESGTEVFNPTTAAVTTDITNNFAADLWFGNNTSGDGGANAHTFASRLTGLKWLQTATNLNETTASNSFYWDSNTEFTNSQFGGDRVEYFLKRATGFFDVVAYTGDGINARQITHNLKAEPELIISKKRSATSDWIVYAKNNGIAQNAQAILNGNNSFGWYAGLYPSPYATDSVYYIASAAAINQSGQTYIAYLFASLAGVSKVGSYTGTGSNVDVDCGFSAGARFILIKRTDSTGDWYVWDSVRGIVAGNDPYLLLNSTAAEVTTTDYIDPLSSGFTVTSSAPAALNASGGTYIFLAIS